MYGKANLSTTDCGFNRIVEIAPKVHLHKLMTIVMLKLIKYLAGLVATALGCFAYHAHAETPMTWSQVPGYYRMQLGQFEITALFDGALELDRKLLTNSSATDIELLLARMFVRTPNMQTAVNAYLINTGKTLVLVDTGAAKLFGPTLGHVAQNLKAAGYDTAQVDVVALTHLHGDHFGGLNDPSGQPIFGNARIVVSKDESEYWLSTLIADAAPASAKRTFKRVRDAAAPYLASNQWHVFRPGDVIVPGITAVGANGHTPGHTAFSVESDGHRLFIWGDLVHAHAVQFMRPEVSIEFDFDQVQAIATRRKFMKELSDTKSVVAGMHLPFPGIGHVREESAGSYSWVPIEFAPLDRNAGK